MESELHRYPVLIHAGCRGLRHEMTTPDEPDRPSPELLGLPELAKAVESDDFKRILDHVPIAVVVSRLHGELPCIIYVNTALEGLLGLTMANVQGQSWSVFDDFTHE